MRYGSSKNCINFTDKWKNFTSVAMSPTYIPFRPKTDFKNKFCFSQVDTSSTLTTALKKCHCGRNSGEGEIPPPPSFYRRLAEVSRKKIKRNKKRIGVWERVLLLQKILNQSEAVKGGSTQCGRKRYKMGGGDNRRRRRFAPKQRRSSYKTKRKRTESGKGVQWHVN